MLCFCPKNRQLWPIFRWLKTVFYALAAKLGSFCTRYPSLILTRPFFDSLTGGELSNPIKLLYPWVLLPLRVLLTPEKPLNALYPLWHLTHFTVKSPLFLWVWKHFTAQRLPPFDKGPISNGLGHHTDFPATVQVVQFVQVLNLAFRTKETGPAFLLVSLNAFADC